MLKTDNTTQMVFFSYIIVTFSVLKQVGSLIVDGNFNQNPSKDMQISFSNCRLQNKLEGNVLSHDGKVSIFALHIKCKKMKVRDSGMPAETLWDTFFDIDLILSELDINAQVTDLVEIGSGYGTFTIPAAECIKGNLYAFDIDPDMIAIVKQKLADVHIANVIVSHRDILAQTTGLADDSVDYVMLFNILHHDTPMDLFTEAYRILKPQGKIGIIHWRSDISTPRGPDISIRPTPEQMVTLIDKQKFNIDKEPFIIEPYHYGILISKYYCPMERRIRI